LARIVLRGLTRAKEITSGKDQARNVKEAELRVRGRKEAIVSPVISHRGLLKTDLPNNPGKATIQISAHLETGPHKANRVGSVAEIRTGGDQAAQTGRAREIVQGVIREKKKDLKHRQPNSDFK
jgi:hypothetical protein